MDTFLLLSVVGIIVGVIAALAQILDAVRLVQGTREERKELQKKAWQKIEEISRHPSIQELALFGGGVLVGIFVNGFLSNISTRNPLFISIYVVLGFIGIFLLLWGLRSKTEKDRWKS